MRFSLTSLCLLFSGLAAAQDTQPFVGTWKVSWQGERGITEARLVIEASGGSWQTLARKKADPCQGLKVPIVLQDIEADSVTVYAKFGETLGGCQDAHIKLRKTDADHMVGTRGEKEVRAVRD